MSEREFGRLNFALSGWTGAGTSTVTLILAWLLRKEYINIGGLFRELGMQLGYADEGKDRPAADEYLETHIGKILDMYVDHVLLNDRGVILESDLSAFRIGKRPEVVSIFLMAKVEARSARVVSDGRHDAHKTLEIRDELLSKKYKELWDLDLFNVEFIATKYDLVMDVSDCGVEEEVKNILQYLYTLFDFKPLILEAIDDNTIDQIVKLYFTLGKEPWRAKLHEAGLLRTNNQIKHEIVSLFSEELNECPDDIKRVLHE